MNHFQYRENELFCEDVPLKKIAADVGTPTYVYSSATLQRHYGVFDEALSHTKHIVCYSVKANSNLSVLQLLFSMGAGADIVSGGELARVLAAGGDPKKIVFSGVGKKPAEMAQALDAGILAFNVESIAELDALHAVAKSKNTKARVSLRINPDVDAQTHPYISTGMKENKFGIASAHAMKAFSHAATLDGLEVVGLDCHIGSQLTQTGPFADATAKMVELLDEIETTLSLKLQYLDIGGGLGIPYGEDDSSPPSPKAYGDAIERALTPLKGRGMTLICEPGRVISGNAGVLLSEVLYMKQSGEKNFAIVDAAINDLMRPALYGSFHPIRPVRKYADREPFVADIVGPVCETGDFLARDRKLETLFAGDLIVVGAAGAYGFTMSSNYNTRGRAAEVLVEGDSYRVVRRRETTEDLLRLEMEGLQKKILALSQLAARSPLGGDCSLVSPFSLASPFSIFSTFSTEGASATCTRASLKQAPPPTSERVCGMRAFAVPPFSELSHQSPFGMTAVPSNRSGFICAGTNSSPRPLNTRTLSPG